MLITLSGAVAALHKLSQGCNVDPTHKINEELNAVFEKGGENTSQDRGNCRTG